MKPSRIILIRHGQSLGNVDHSAYHRMPDWRVPLTEEGWSQARGAGVTISAMMPTDSRLGVYISPFVRTQETWKGIAAILSARPFHMVQWIKEDPRLREQEWGRLKSVEERRACQEESWAYGTFFYRFPNGESGADVYDRCTDFLGTLYRDFEHPDCPPHILIVTHGFTLRLLLMRWLHWTVDEFHSLKNPSNCAMVELRRGEDDHYHLSAPFPRRE